MSEQGELDAEDSFDAETVAFLETFRAYATKNYGERCEDYEKGCPCCDLWALYDSVETLIKV